MGDSYRKRTGMILAGEEAKRLQMERGGEKKLNDCPSGFYRQLPPGTERNHAIRSFVNS